MIFYYLRECHDLLLPKAVGFGVGWICVMLQTFAQHNGLSWTPLRIFPRILDWSVVWLTYELRAKLQRISVRKNVDVV